MICFKSFAVRFFLKNNCFSCPTASLIHSLKFSSMKLGILFVNLLLGKIYADYTNYTKGFFVRVLNQITLIFQGLYMRNNFITGWNNFTSSYLKELVKWLRLTIYNFSISYFVLEISRNEKFGLKKTLFERTFEVIKIELQYSCRVSQFSL